MRCLDVFECLRVVGAVELWGQNGAVGGQEVEVVRLEGVFGRAGQVPLHGVNGQCRFLGYVGRRAQRDLFVYLNLAAASVHRLEERGGSLMLSVEVCLIRGDVALYLDDLLDA